MGAKLTKKQAELVAELRQIRELFRLDFERIGDVAPDSRTVQLELMRSDLVRGQVIVWYTLVDEFLANRICRFFFGRKRPFPQLWRTKRFRLFNYHVIEVLSLRQKLAFAKAISPIPRPVSKDIDRLNDLRNGLAHSFFPENRKAKPLWKGKDVFTIDGLRVLETDVQRIFTFFWPDED